MSAQTVESAILIYQALSMLLSLIPLRYYHHPVWGKALWIFGRLSDLVPKDAKGTAKLPFAPIPPLACPPGIDVRKAPALTVLLALALALAGCRGMPPPDGCTPNAQRCHEGRPQVCSSTTRWTYADGVCAEHGGVCCMTPSVWSDAMVYACVPLERCHGSDGGLP